MNIIEKIVAHKKTEVAQLYNSYTIRQLKTEVKPSNKSFYNALAIHKVENRKFIISEFKRRSPSAGAINEEIDIAQQVNFYIEKNFSAVSVLTDKDFFGGTYEDLQEASAILENTDLLLLNKEFIIDPIQVYLARKFGANIILLIAAILTTEEFKALKELSESLGMGVLSEIHNVTEYRVIESLDCPVIGINNRDLTRFKTSINNTNYLVEKLNLHDKFIVAESGLASDLDVKIVSQKSNAYLVGTSLMQNEQFDLQNPQQTFFKACGIRKFSDIEPAEISADLLGFNFSPVSKRKIELAELEKMSAENFKRNVAVFYKNTETEILETLKKFPFKYVQLYFNDVSIDFIKELKQKVILAVKVANTTNWKALETNIPYTDLLILDGNAPGSGAEIQENLIPKNFAYPFLLAGGIHSGNLQKVTQFDNCIGVDVASGIETEGEVDLNKIKCIYNKIQDLKQLSISE